MHRQISGRAVIGLLRRIVTAGLMLAAAIDLGLGHPVRAGALVASAITLYALTRPGNRATFRMAPEPAVIGPDWLGFVWIATLGAIPIWASATDPGTHASAWLLWPMAGLGAVFLLIAWQSESLAVTPGPREIRLSKGLWQITLRRSAIAAVARERVDLPRWMRLLSPLLAASHPATAGAIRLARPRNRLRLTLTDGTILRIGTDSLHPDVGSLIRDLAPPPGHAP